MLQWLERGDRYICDCSDRQKKDYKEYTYDKKEEATNKNEMASLL